MRCAPNPMGLWLEWMDIFNVCVKKSSTLPGKLSWEMDVSAACSFFCDPRQSWQWLHCQWVIPCFQRISLESMVKRWVCAVTLRPYKPDKLPLLPPLAPPLTHTLSFYSNYCHSFPQSLFHPTRSFYSTLVVSLVYQPFLTYSPWSGTRSFWLPLLPWLWHHLSQPLPSPRMGLALK